MTAIIRNFYKAVILKMDVKGGFCTKSRHIEHAYDNYA